jgi:hypothetical protein
VSVSLSFDLSSASCGETDRFKLVFSNCGQLLSGMACSILVINHYSLSAYISSTLYRTALTMVFTLLLSIPHKFDLHFTDDKISNMITISTGVSALTVELMKMEPNAYQYSLFY